MRKKSIRSFVLAMSVVALAGVAGTAAAADKQDSKPVLTVLTIPSFVPFESMDKKTGKMVGYDMDILAAVAKRAGFDYKLKTMQFSGIIPALQTGSADIAISAITITPERDKVVDFSVPYYQSGLSIMVRADNNTIHKLDDLKGHSISTKIGSTSYDFLTKKFGDSATIKPYPTTDTMYMALMSGNVDAAFYDTPNVAYFARVRGKDKVKMVGPLYEAQPYGLAFVQGSKWVKPVNKALKAMKADGSFAKIYKKWFGKLPQGAKDAS